MHTRHGSGNDARLGRRSLLKGASAAAGGLAAGAALGGYGRALAQDATPPVALPGGSPIAVPVVDESGYYPSGTPGIADAYTRFPEPFQATDGVPGSGGTVTALMMIYGAPAASMNDNQYWQGLNERLGVSWEPIQVPNANYGERASAIIASGDLPDLFYLNFNQTLTPLHRFVLEGAFLDLTDYLTGDALQEYPNLARFPDFMWDATRTNGRIYGVPCPSGRAGEVSAIRSDWAQALIGGTPTNADDTFRFFTEATSGDPDGNGSDDTWGMGRFSTSWDLGLFYPMFRSANNWAVDDAGAFTHQVETDEWRATVEFIRELYDGGAFHPDSPSMGFLECLELFQSGRSAIMSSYAGSLYGETGHIETLRQYQDDPQVELVIPYGHDGGAGVTHNLPGIFGFTAIGFQHERDDERIRELLRIFDWLSSPYGSEEWLFKSNGLEGTHFDFNEQGFPVTNDLWTQENGELTAYIGGSLLVNAVPADPSLGPVITESEKAIYEIGIDNPAAYLFSEASIAEGSALSTFVADTLANFITGREDASVLDALPAEWASRGGDQIRAEFEEAWAAGQE